MTVAGHDAGAVCVSTDWSLRGFDAVVVENELLRLVVLPGLGAKIVRLDHKRRDLPLLWANPRNPIRPPAFGASYDDHFFGGWDELYPNDEPETHGGEALPDHGELWSLPWSSRWDRDDDGSVRLHLSVDTPVTASRVEKVLTVRPGEPMVHLSHRITNLGPVAQPFLWKMHVALALHAGSRLDMGARTMRVEDFGSPRGGPGAEYTWPYLTAGEGTRHDMRLLPAPGSSTAEFQYATSMDAGWCALTHPDRGVGLGLAFDTAQVPSCWVFASYGGWRGLHTLVLEPCTGYPASLAQGLAQGTHRTLPAGGTFETEVTAVLYEGLSQVTSVGRDGAVRG